METAAFGNGWEGRVVEGRFPLLERLEGSENCVSFLTVLQGLQEAVIQLISTDAAESDAYIAQWEFVKTLSHPHLAKILAAGRCVIDQRDLVYVATERPYATLSQTIQTRTLKADSARETFDPILNALSYLHKNGIVHGHVNPSNIRLAEMKLKLSVTDLLIAGTGKRSISRPIPRRQCLGHCFAKRHPKRPHIGCLGCHALSQLWRIVVSASRNAPLRCARDQ